MKCLKCSFFNSVAAIKCKNCGVEFYCIWEASWYRNRWTLISIGHSETGRKIGNYVVVLASLLMMYGIYQGGYRWGGLGAALVAICGFFIYEIWCFFHGREVWVIRGFLCKGTPEYTNWRLVSLALDTAIFSVLLTSLWF